MLWHKWANDISKYPYTGTFPYIPRTRANELDFMHTPVSLYFSPKQDELLPFTDGVAVIVLKCLNSLLKKRKLIIKMLTASIYLQFYHGTSNVSLRS